MRIIQNDMMLKCHPGPFRAIWRGQKKGELRIDDRGYQVGDRILLVEWDPKRRSCFYPHRSIVIEITHLIHAAQSFGALKDGFCFFSFNVLLKRMDGSKDRRLCRGCREGLEPTNG